MKSALIGLCLTLAACSAIGSTDTPTPELTEEYGCGYGFYVGSADQTAGLFLQYEDFEGAQSGEVAVSSQIPGGSWNAELRFGADLFSNWCDDVIEPGEPEVVVEETWEVSGHVEIVDLPGAGQCGPATAELSGLTARNGDGDVIPLGDYEVQNESWGCLAG
jgi:hypothetical protein